MYPLKGGLSCFTHGQRAPYVINGTISAITLFETKAVIISRTTTFHVFRSTIKRQHLVSLSRLPRFSISGRDAIFLCAGSRAHLRWIRVALWLPLSLVAAPSSTPLLTHNCVSFASTALAVLSLRRRRRRRRRTLLQWRPKSTSILPSPMP